MSAASSPRHRVTPTRHRPGRAVLITVLTMIIVAALAVVGSDLSAPDAIASGMSGNHAVPTRVTNTASIVNDDDEPHLGDLAWTLYRTTGAVEARNLAVARSTGSRLRTTAVAFEIVLVNNAAGQARVLNHAITNSRYCANCDTTAVAYQFVLLSDESINISAAGMTALWTIRRQLRRLVDSPATGAQVIAETDALAALVRTVLAENTVARPTAGRRGTTTPQRQSRSPTVSVDRQVSVDRP